MFSNGRLMVFSFLVLLKRRATACSECVHSRRKTQILGSLFSLL